MNSKVKSDSVEFFIPFHPQAENSRGMLRLFFEDLCTVPEIKAMSQRLEVAHMLSNNCVYSDIVAKTGASTATISRVNRSLNYGNDGYELVFSRMAEASEPDSEQ